MVFFKNFKQFIIGALSIYYNLLLFINRSQALRSLFILFTSPKFQKIRDREKKVLNQIKNKIEIDDYVLSYYQSLQGTGPCVLLLHGWESNAGSMGAFVNPLIQNFSTEPKRYHLFH